VKRFALLLAAGVAVLLGSAPAYPQAAPITRSARFIGNINFVATGGTLRTQPNTVDACAVGATSAGNVTGVPAGATMLAAYLYWGGSGATVDSNVTLNGNAIAAGRTFTTIFSTGGTDFPYFGGFANVTTLVTGNGAFTFGGLTVNSGAPHCASAAVVAGWGLVVIYQLASENLRAVNVFDGLQFFRGSSLTLTPDGFRVPVSPINGQMAIIAWEGDPQNSLPLNGFSEELRYNGILIDDGIIVVGSDPLVQPYDGTINTQGISTSYGVDVDTFNVSALMLPGQTSATTLFSAGGDLVLLTAQVVSTTTEPVVDLRITKSHVGNFTVGGVGDYTIRVTNGAVAVDPELQTVTVTDTLPTGFSFVSGTGIGWSCSVAGQIVTCTHPPPVAPGATLPDLTLRVSIGAGAQPLSVNTASVSSNSFDLDPSNNTATDPTIVNPLFPTLVVQKTSQVLTDPVNLGANPKRIPGSVVEYAVTVTNTGPGTVDASTLAISDPLPANSHLYVSTVSGNPVTFTDGTPASGLSYSYASDVSFSNQPAGGAPYNYTPVPDADGFDPAVRGLRIAPTGVMNAAGAGNPNFTVRFRVRVP